MKKYIRGPTDFGGSLDRGKRKNARTLVFPADLHLVLKAEDSVPLLPKTREIESAISRFSQRFSVGLLNVAVHIDHVHCAARLQNNPQYCRWVRAITGLLSKDFKIKWKFLPFSKIVGDEKHRENLLRYVELNKREAQFILDNHRLVERWIEAHVPSLNRILYPKQCGSET